jgi:hypothetical protein
MIKHLLVFTFVLSTMSIGGSSDAVAKMQFEVTISPNVSPDAVTGRMFLILTRDNSREPRLQVARYSPQLFGVDVDQLEAGKSVTIDEQTLGYPINGLKDLPAGDYYIQGVFNKYTRFNRSDGHTLWMHMDQWEGQNWRRSPGNFFSEVQKFTHDPNKSQTIKLVTSQTIPPIEVPADTPWVKRIKIQSKILTAFWGHPIFIGATVLLPKGYDQHPNVSYPTVYEQGHFSLRAPFRFETDEGLTASWKGDNFPRFIAITLQHPTPYFDDSYAVNTANNGPYGDAIHQELLPEIERQFRTIKASYARVLTGGSTGGWESFALQVFYPDIYGGTWSFAPDPLDFRNVEGINIYEDTNAFYKVHEWYTIPTANTRFHTNGEVRLTSAQRNTMELVHGTRGRSGQQLDIWSAVHGPVGENGYFKPLFNKKSGVIDPTVAQYWKEHFDLRYYLENNWMKVGPNLVGKLHIICGHMDNFYLNVGVYHMEEFLESTRKPYYAGSVTYGARGSHGWRPYTRPQLLQIMSEHITQNAPAGANSQAWKY